MRRRLRYLCGRGRLWMLWGFWIVYFLDNRIYRSYEKL